MDQRTTSPQRLLDVLEDLLRLPARDLKTTLDHVGNLMAAATGADKIDLFLYDPARDSLVALGTSTQPLSALQRQHGLDVLQISNGGRVVHVYKTGETFMSGRLDQDEEELIGVRQALGIKSKLGVPLDIGGKRRGMMMLASLRTDFFTAEDARFAEAVARWIGIVAHRAELAEQIGRNAASQARRAAAEELVTVLAHDLRNFLAPLSLRLEMLRARAQGPDREVDRAELDAAARTLARLGSLISDLLDIARIDQGLFQIQPQIVDLGALVTEVSSLFDSPQHPVVVSLPGGEPLHVHVDAARMRQSLENLIANAAQQSPAAAPVSIFVQRGKRDRIGNVVLVEVVDEGPGIPEHILPRVFDRYVTNDARSGLGLGLYLAKRIAELHGGELTVKSAPGKGTRFILTVPAASVTMKPRRVLIADDDPEMRESLARALDVAGYAVEVARDGDEAIKLQAQRPAEVLITDIFMPGRDGLETIQFFNATYPEVRIIAMTGGSPTGRSDEYLQVAEVAGASATLHKPFAAQALLDRLSAL